MVLEETLLFYEEKDAEIFIRFLHEKKCRVQKKNESSINEDSEISGTIGNFIRLIEAKMESELQEREKDPAIQEGSTPEPGISPYLAGRKISFGESNKKGLENLRSTRDYIENIMARYNPGDIIFTNDNIKELSERIRNHFNDVTVEDLDEIFFEEILVQGNLLTMEDNGIVETRPEGICLIKKIDPNDLIVDRAPWRPGEVDPETLNQYGIVPKIHIDFEIATRITIDPKIHFTCKLEEVEEVLDELDADEFSEDELKRNLVLKGLAIESIITTIENSGRISLTDLIRDMNIITPKINDDKEQIIEHFSQEFITGIVNDLRKIGVIEGNDRKMRIVT